MNVALRDVLSVVLSVVLRLFEVVLRLFEGYFLRLYRVLF